MFPIPAAAEPLVQAIAAAFTEPTFRRFLTLACGLIVTMGRRTVSHSLVPVVPLVASMPPRRRRRQCWALERLSPAVLVGAVLDVEAGGGTGAAGGGIAAGGRGDRSRLR